MIRSCKRLIAVFVVLLAASFPIHADAAADAPEADAGVPQMEWQTAPMGTMSLEYMAADQLFLPHLNEYLGNGRQTVRDFFNRDFPDTFVVRVFPDRATMTAFWRAEWGIPDLETECWMVASGTASTLSLLSPRAWKIDACEHDASDTVRTQMLITHEMVHTFHGQFNPRPEFDGLDSIGWFIEGLAVYVSGQLDGPYLANAHEADSLGHVPEQLEDAWSGKYRYGVSGSIIAYIDQTFGRQVILGLLPATSEAEILKKLGTTEERLLGDWRSWLAGK